jgi:DNA-binding XRE family transcriptional regulator
MQALTKKRPTENAEARFVGGHAQIARLRHLAKQMNVMDLSPDDEERQYTVEEVFPELATNRAGVLIRGYRGREGMTQRQLAEATGIPQRHISEMEHGKRIVGRERAQRLAKALKADYRMFL